MSDTRDPRIRPFSADGARAGHDPRCAWRARAAAVAVAGAVGLVLALACADVEPKRARPASSASGTSSAAGSGASGSGATGSSASGANTPRATAPTDGDQPDLGLPTRRTVDAAERRAPLELDLPAQRVERVRRDAAPRPEAPPTVAAPRVVDRVRVTVRDQRLQLLSGREVLREYPVSTARNGVGSQVGSQRTPLGQHRVHSKFGTGEPLGTVFEARRATGKLATIHTAPVDLPEDVITTRILWLEGLEAGKNRGKGVDSHTRFIYIHGTNEEGLIGRPASHGCVRMRNRDVVELYELVAVGTPVEILE